MSSGTITIRKDALWKYASFVLAAFVIVLIVVMVTGDKELGGTVTNTNPTPSTGTQAPAKVAASVDDDASMGDEDADVTIIEFSDYECPFCKRHEDQTVASIKQNYVDNGKVKYVFRDFTPTLSNPSYHPNAVIAAMSAECAGKAGGDEAYWEMHSALFANQGSNSAESVKNLAKNLGYDISSCLDSEEMKAEVQADFADGQKYGIRGTPGFLIGSDGKYQVLSGACPYSAFQQAFDAELAGKNWYSPGNCQVVVN